VTGVGYGGTRAGPGKRGRVACVEGEQATHKDSIMPDVQVPTQSEEPSGDHHPEPPLNSESHTEIEYDMCDLYAVGGSGVVSKNEPAERPFVHKVQLLGPKGEIVRVHVVFNDSAMICTMCAQIYKKVKHQLKGWQPSKCVLHMANGALVKSQAMWTGIVRLGSIQVQGTIEVFDSRGGWSFLFGKPMLRAFKANHDYELDTIQVRDSQSVTELTNQIDTEYYAKWANGEAPVVTD
jgi:hypothetical protein